ncbi:MAG: hypothetical protein K2Q14_01020 [Gammaproteobacteria bacterium]|nr:hypothetical protein [Gammaproteobacteria bacterium]
MERSIYSLFSTDSIIQSEQVPVARDADENLARAREEAAERDEAPVTTPVPR